MRYFVFLLLLFLLLQIVLARGLGEVIDRSDEVKYNVLVVDEMENTEGATPISIVSPMDKRKYTCWLPSPWLDDDEEEVEGEAPSISKLLEPMETYCLYRLAGWWTYEFCYGKHIRQYHQEKDKPIRPQDEFFLGKKNELNEGYSNSEYYSEIYDSGTQCDLTGEKRKTEIRYYCSNDKLGASIVDLKEPSSCSYIFSISTPHLCKHPDYKPPKEKLQTIKCVPLEKPLVKEQEPQEEQSYEEDFSDEDDTIEKQSSTGFGDIIFKTESTDSKSKFQKITKVIDLDKLKKSQSDKGAEGEEEEEEEEDYEDYEGFTTIEVPLEEFIAQLMAGGSISQEVGEQLLQMDLNEVNQKEEEEEQEVEESKTKSRKFL